MNSGMVIASLLCLFSCFSSSNSKIIVTPKFISSAKGETPHLALVIRTINNTNAKYLFLGGHLFEKYFRITKLSKSGKWEPIMHPSELETEERKQIESKTKELSYYKDDYHSRNPLFKKWVLSAGSKSIELDHLNLTLNNEISEALLLKNSDACVPSSFSLFFVEKESTYEQFWSMDFMLKEKGRYRVFFSPDDKTLPCDYAFKGFQLSSNQIVQFGSAEIVTH